MNIELIVVGKTEEKWLQEGISQYNSRLGHYVNFKTDVIPSLKNVKNLSAHLLKQKEGEQLLSRINNTDYVVVLDEKGKQFTSVEFASSIQSYMNAGHKRVVFIVGGAFGFSDEVYARANAKISLSKMTFSHQMIRLFFVEQLYRAMTILKGEKYHHE
ncbi:MAG: 23S rRNA (pseudouridine(1915)-N(3))-methyltransferase RlmH [Bacteroidetes bacterium]|nr:23S rRNA (pseudouridine(1915)-N(3))-methyltransferase RlmH [Bacteroidota bacterium]